MPLLWAKDDDIFKLESIPDIKYSKCIYQNGQYIGRLLHSDYCVIFK